MPFKHQIVPAKVSQWFIPVWSNFNENISVHSTQHARPRTHAGLCNILAHSSECSIWFFRTHISIECRRRMCDVHVPRNTILFVDPKLKSMSKFTFFIVLLSFGHLPPDPTHIVTVSIFRCALIPSQFRFSWEVKINNCKQTKFQSMCLCSGDSCQLKSVPFFLVVGLCVCVHFLSSFLKLSAFLQSSKILVCLIEKNDVDGDVLFDAQADGHGHFQCALAWVLLTFFCFLFSFVR